MKAFVLKVVPLGERDVLATVISRERGKERLRAPGVRRSSAKLKGHLQPLGWSIVHTAAGRTHRVVVDAETVEKEPPFSAQVLRSLWVLGDLVDVLTIEREPTSVFFSYLERATAVVRSPETTHPVSAALFWVGRLFHEAGYALAAASCGSCGNSLERGAVWAPSHKGLLCRSCSAEFREFRSLSPDLLKVLWLLQNGGEEHAVRLRLDELLQREACCFLCDSARFLSGSLSL